MGDKSCNYPDIYTGDQLKKNETEGVGAHGLRNSGKHEIMNADLVRFAIKLITSVW
jgi:hypothetical protein